MQRVLPFAGAGTAAHGHPMYGLAAIGIAKTLAVQGVFYPWQKFGKGLTLHRAHPQKPPFPAQFVGAHGVNDPDIP